MLVTLKFSKGFNFPKIWYGIRYQILVPDFTSRSAPKLQWEYIKNTQRHVTQQMSEPFNHHLVRGVGVNLVWFLKFHFLAQINEK